jgi:hypothetical protein
LDYKGIQATWDGWLLDLSERGKGKGKGLHSYIRQRGQLSYSIKSQLQEEKEARLNKTPEKEARGNMKLMYERCMNEVNLKTNQVKRD